MALETISQVLSSTNATYINGVSAERRISAAILANVYQGLVEKGNRGVNDRFVSEDDAESAAQVFVNRVVPVKIKPREMGANKNGASFANASHYTQTITVGIDLLQVLDETIVIPRARQDMIKVDLLAEQIKIYSDRQRTIINGATAAAKILKTWVEEADGHEVNKKVLNSATILNDFVGANSLLDMGDMENGVDIFPEDTRIAVFKPNYRATLKTSGILVLGGANYAYDIAKGAGISHEAEVRKLEDGYIGDIDGVPCHIISNESLAHASEFLGLPATELLKCPLVGYLSSSYANARGVSVSRTTKIVPAITGQGLVLQPYTKFGCVSFYAKGNVLLYSEDYNPFKWLEETFSSANINFKLKGAGSRLYATIPATGWTLGASSFTLTGAVALDDWNNDHIEGAYFYVGTAPANSVADFLDKAEDATYKGTFTVGTSKSTTIADGQFVNVLLVADDGTITLGYAKYEA